jgi:AbrB family looped-hinge helix DNA binding protein
METVTVSSKYWVVIPSRFRRRLGLKLGQELQVILYDNRIEMIPVRPARELRGFLKGIDTAVEREPVDPERNCLHHPSDV